jgi:hypothetical protein
VTRLPGAFVAVAAWLSLLFLVATMPLARALAGYTGEQPDAPVHVKVTWLIVFASAVALIVGLLRLRPAGIWLSASLAGLFGAGTVARLPGIIANGALPIFVALHAVLGAVNLACAFYLTRPGVQAILERRRMERLAPRPEGPG